MVFAYPHALGGGVFIVAFFNTNADTDDAFVVVIFTTGAEALLAGDFYCTTPTSPVLPSSETLAASVRPSASPTLWAVLANTSTTEASVA